ncbi:pyruvate dehydrogenase E2 component (dihydrolipoamide acetyltransferase) [Chiayiivirga flava]|uniref:Pyruvate dehydrogenase E2 component (Dihydrolipoamide acetyltransferase) n=1 Tax=Chiayiivirga flava TaxID=659595 RepID=A0A7W8G2Z3_9GAMM|nr:pyruvate dehydrogenase E2 component (dihydrolipoamide acetyltransferase) [Chiayiivirga flava]
MRIAGNAGDVIETGSVLAEFAIDPSLPQRAEAQDTGHHHGGAHGDEHGAGGKGAGAPVPAEHTRDDGGAVTVNASDDGGEIASEDDAPANSAPGPGAGAGGAGSTGRPVSQGSTDRESPGPLPNPSPGGRGAVSAGAGNADGASASAAAGRSAGADAANEREDAGTVVGAMQAGGGVRSEQAVVVGGVKAMPAVRALAKKLKVDLSRVRASGADGVVTMQDVKDAAARGDAAPSASATSPQPSFPRTREPSDLGSSSLAEKSTERLLDSRVRGNDGVEGRGNAGGPGSAATRAATSATSRDAPAFDTDEPIRGVRRNMIRVMAAAHAEVVPTTLMDDADIHAWQKGEDLMARLVRGLVVAAKAEPALNAWFKPKEGTLRRHARVDVGIAVDGSEGLFVPALRDCDRRDAKDIRAELNRLRNGVQDRSLAPEELRDYTISLSNFGVFAGKYATPVVVPPCVAIVGAGRLFHAVVPVLGGLETRRMLPLSLTFDHRAATGGEAARFLRALIDDLQRGR